MHIELEHVAHAYTGGATVLAPLDHAFASGSMTVITGPSGSGKSTLLAIVALLLTPSAGTVRWAGTAIGNASDSARSYARARHLGYVFQDAMLDLSRTGLENVLEASWLARIPTQVAEPRARTLLDELGVGEHADRRPGKVSGGQAQRIALCRALVKEPSLLLADEPTGNLDEESAEVVWDALARTAERGATVVVVTHDRARALRLAGSGTASHLQLGSVS